MIFVQFNEKLCKKFEFGSNSWKLNYRIKNEQNIVELLVT